MNYPPYVQRWRWGSDRRDKNCEAMKFPKLAQFLKTTTDNPGRSYVTLPRFKELYVRRGPRFLGGKRVANVLDIARIEARKPGTGAFTSLATKLLAKGIPLYVESVLEPRFAKKLLAMGFKMSETSTNSYYKLPDQEAS